MRTLLLTMLPADRHELQELCKACDGTAIVEDVDQWLYYRLACDAGSGNMDIVAQKSG